MGDENNFDLSGLSSDFDLSGLEGMNLGSFDLGGIDLSGLSSDFDLSGLDSTIQNIDWGSLYADIDTSNLAERGDNIVDQYLGNNPAALEPPSKYSLLPDRSTGVFNQIKTGQDQVGAADELGGGIKVTSPAIRDYTGAIDTRPEAMLPKSELYALSTAPSEPGLKYKGDITPGLDKMNGAQGLTTYNPEQKFQYDDTLSSMVKAHPGEFSTLEKYVSDLTDKGDQTIRNTGGNIGAAGFTPSGSSYAIGDPRSFINNPNVTGEPGVVSANQTAVRSPNAFTPGGFGKSPGVNVASGSTPITPGKTPLQDLITRITGGGGGGSGGGIGGGSGGGGSGSKSGLDSILPLLLMMLAMNQSKGGGGAGATIPKLDASTTQLPYGNTQQAAGYRPGQGGITYFSPTQYTPKMAGGGGIGDLQGSRLLDGPGDGVSDSIPATIGGFAGGGQPARLARGEYVMDARTVAALGNGSTDAGAERLDAMRKKILSSDRKAGIGADSKAYRHLMA
jgi:hypothetical protein